MSPAERCWLEEAAKPDFQVQTAKVRLRKVLPRDFYPEQLDGRLYSSGHITPVGLWHLNSQHPRLTTLDKVIRAIKEQIDNERYPRVVSAGDIAQKAGLTSEAAGEAFYALGQIGHYFHTAKGSAVSGGRSYDQIELTDQNSYDNYLHYDGMDDLLERFYLWRGQNLYGPNRAISAPVAAANGATSSGVPTASETRTRVDRMLTAIKNNRIIAIIIVIGVAIVGLGNVVDGAKKLFPFAPEVSGSPPEGGEQPSHDVHTPVQQALAHKECVDRELANLKARQNFSQPGGVSCEGAGPSTRGVKRSTDVVYAAPPGFQIAVPVVPRETSNIDGAIGPVDYDEEGGVVTKVSIPISCRSEDKPFGSGASEQIVLEGTIERIVSSADMEAIKARCE